MFSPRNKFETKVSELMRFMNPYIAFVTYRFHVEKCREIGMYKFYFLFFFICQLMFGWSVWSKNFIINPIINKK